MPLGTVYKLSVGLGPFVETMPTYGTGTPVTILGTNLIGATSVIFNGTAQHLTLSRLPKSPPPYQPVRPLAQSR